MKILEFLKWLFGEIFKLNAIKMLLVLAFLAFMTFMYFQYKEVITEGVKIETERTNE